jgi:hypothetical protein
MDHLNNLTTSYAQESGTPDLALKLLIFWSDSEETAAQDSCPCGQ